MNHIIGVVNFSIVDGRIQSIYHLFNPDKLQRIEQALAEAEEISFDDSMSE